MKWQEAHVKARVLLHRFTCTLLMSLSHALAALQPANSPATTVLQVLGYISIPRNSCWIMDFYMRYHLQLSQRCF